MCPATPIVNPPGLSLGNPPDRCQPLVLATAHENDSHFAQGDVKSPEGRSGLGVAGVDESIELCQEILAIIRLA